MLARRGSDRKWYFSGQEPGEIVKLVVRKHWFFLIPAALPLIGSLAFLLLLTWLSTSRPTLASLWDVLFVLDGLLIIGTGIWFVWKDLLEWWFESYIVTDKRIISGGGILQPTRQETPIDKIVQIGLDYDSLLAYLLKYGNMHLYLVGGQLVIKHIPNPRHVKDVIQGISGAIKAKQPPKEKTPVPQDPDMAALLDNLKKGKEVKKLPDADEKYPPFPNPDHLPGPRRKFGFPAGMYADVHYLSGEYTVMYLQRSLYVLYRRLLLPLLFILLALSAAAIFPAFDVVSPSIAGYWWFLMGLVVFAMLLWAGLVYANYVDDVYILTNMRIIDIERRVMFFFESRAETEYKSIRDIKVRIPNVIERMLDIGNVYIETPGSNPDITLHNVDHPFVVQDTIYNIKGYKDKADQANKEQKEKEAIYDWFGRVVTLLEKKMDSNGVPNLEGKALEVAMAIAGEMDLKVVVKSEVAARGTAPGLVIHQSPPPGTRMVPGGEIQVMVSRRPTPHDMI